MQVNANNTITSDFKTKIYNLWYCRFAYLDATKLRKLYKITILLKLVFIVENIKNLYEVCALIKFYNKRNYYVNMCKTIILILILIDICESLLVLRFRHKYFLEIVNNYSRKTYEVLTITK